MRAGRRALAGCECRAAGGAGRLPFTHEARPQMPCQPGVAGASAEDDGYQVEVGVRDGDQPGISSRGVPVEQYTQDGEVALPGLIGRCSALHLVASLVRLAGAVGELRQAKEHAGAGGSSEEGSRRSACRAQPVEGGRRCAGHPDPGAAGPDHPQARRRSTA